MGICAATDGGLIIYTNDVREVITRFDGLLETSLMDIAFYRGALWIAGKHGSLARMTNQITFFGGVLDSTLDRYADCILLVSFLFVYPFHMLLLLPLYIWVALAMLGFVMVSYTRARGEKERLGDLDVGLGARTERLFILFLFSIFIIPLIGLIITVFLSHLTVLHRVIHFYQLSKTNK